MENVKSRWYHLVALLVVIIWGTTFISTKIILSSGFTPEDILFYRFLLAYIGIWFLGEKITWMAIVGALLILFGMFFAQNRKPAPH